MEMGPKAEKLILTFKNLGKNDIRYAGGKGANLGEMYNSGFPVPPGFVVTAHAYEKFIEETGIKNEISEVLSTLNVDDNVSLQSVASQIQTIIRTENVPSYLQIAIKNAYEDMYLSRYEIPSQAASLINSARDPPFVAVRSSATAEDLPDASFAGQQQTFLNIKNSKEIIESVKDCWASLFTARAIFYRQKKNFDHFKVLIAVIVQKMVDSNKSGVSFSVNPVTSAEDEIIIEGGFGLGEAVVSGAINPDHYVVSKSQMKIIEQRIASKEFMIKRSPEGKNIKIILDEPKRSSQVLQEEEIIAVAKISKMIEEHYSFPQDIEWAIEGKKLFIVQTRPITTLESKQVQETPEQKTVEEPELNEKIAEAELSEDKGISAVEPETKEEILPEQHMQKTSFLVKGVPASRGTATGAVKIVNTPDELSKILQGDILVTKMTDPDFVPGMKRAGAIVTDEGGITSHAAIVSREMGIPAIVGTTNATLVLKDNMIVTVNATKGEVYEGEKEPEQIKENVNETVSEPTEPIERISTSAKIYMNLGIPEMIEKYKNLPIDGIGLMRTEFIIADKIKEHPLKMIKENRSEEYISKLSEGIKTVAKEIYPRPVVVRFSDFKTNEYDNLLGGKEFEPKEENPMIGWRGVSRYVSSKFEPAFRLECKAIKKVRDEGMKNVWVMLPFVRNKAEVKKVIEIMNSEELYRDDDFQIWLMAEVPSMAIIPEHFAQLDIDGVSIGSNDLTQLTLGVDRDSELLASMNYFDERNEAVLHAIKRIIQGFKKYNKTVSICGQAPSTYPEFTDFLIASGITSISVNPDAVIETRKRVAEIEARQKFMKIAHEEEEF